MNTRKALFSIMGAGLLVSLVWFVNNFEILTWDFRNELWAPAYLLVQGRSPYNIRVLYQDGSLAVWLPQIIGLFFPLGFLPLQQASNLWLVINAFSAIGMVTYLTRRNHHQTTGMVMYGLTVVAVLLFPPTVTNLMLGQVDFLVIAILLMCAREIEKRGILAVALGFALAISKPQLGFIVIPSVFLSLILQREWKYSLKLLGALTVILAVSTIPFWIADPNWVKDFLWSLGHNPGWLQPSIFSLLKFHLGQYGFLIWFLIAVSCITISTILWNKLQPHQAILWSMALTTVAAPYIWSWDFTLLLPLFVDTAIRLTKLRSRLVLISAWLICFFFYIWTRQFTESDHRLWWLPFTMLFAVLTSLWMEYRADQKSIFLHTSTHPTHSAE